MNANFFWCIMGIIFAVQTWKGNLSIPVSRQFPARFGQYNLPQLIETRAEPAGAAEQKITPHVVKPVAVFFLQLRPGFFKTGMPGHEGLILIGPEIVQVFYHKQSLSGFGNLRHRRDHAVGEYVFVCPFVDVGYAGIVTNGVKQQDAILFQATIDHFHIRAAIFMSHVFEKTKGITLLHSF